MGWVTCQYTRKPVVVEAVQFLRSNAIDVAEWTQSQILIDYSIMIEADEEDVLSKPLLVLKASKNLRDQSIHEVVEGMWIVKEGQNFSICSDEAFEAQYRSDP